MSQSDEVTEVGVIFQGGPSAGHLIFREGATEIHLRVSDRLEGSSVRRIRRLIPGDRMVVGYSNARQCDEDSPLEGEFRYVKGERTVMARLCRLGDPPPGLRVDESGEGMSFWNEETEKVLFFSFHRHSELRYEFANEHLGQWRVLELINTDSGKVKLLDASYPDSDT